MKQIQLCKRIDNDWQISRISNYEQGIREPDAETAILLASALGLGITPSEIMFGPLPRHIVLLYEEKERESAERKPSNRLMACNR